MASIAVYNAEGKEAGKIDLNDAVFGVSPNEALVHQVFVAQEANRRQPWAHAKDRSDVRGGGKKPWRQKGTGRARHGSNRSPIWTGGGVTFGPLKDRNYKQKINTKMKRTAVRMCLSDKVTTGQLVVVDGLSTDGKTKAVAAFRSKLPGAGRSTLMLAPAKDENLNRATRNIPRLDLQQVADVSVADLMTHQFVIITKEGITALEKRLG